MTPLSRRVPPAAFGPSLDRVTLQSVRERAIYRAVLLSIPLLSPLPFRRASLRGSASVNRRKVRQ